MQNTFKLDEAPSNRAIHAAVEKRVPVVLESASFKGVTINGALMSSDGRALLIEVSGRPAIDLKKLIGAHFDGQIYGERRFSFSSRIETVFAWGQSICLSVERPSRLVVLERRRFIRAKLAPSSKVTLAWSAAGRSHRHQANLLNISAEGLACRMDDELAALIDPAHRLTVTFELPGGEGATELAAILTNKVPGSEGCSLVGLHFIRSENDAPIIAKLRAALAARQDRAMQLAGEE